MLSPENRRDFVILLVLMLTGGILRFYHLGGLSLWNNEDYLAISVKAILETGIPIFPSEVVYPRALAMSYITAAFVNLFGFSEFTIRLPSAIFSTLSILLIYIFARQVIGRQTALIAATIMSVFFWEIVMAQMGRMYAMFSFLTLLSFVLIHAAEIENKRNLRIPALITLALATSLHSIALTIIPMLLILTPYFINKGRKPSILLLYILVLILSYMVSNQFSKSEYQHWHGLSEQKIEVTADNIDKKESTLSMVIKNATPLLQKNVLTTAHNKAYWIAITALTVTLSLACIFIANLRLLFACLTLMTIALAFQQAIAAACLWLLFLLAGNWLRAKHYKLSSLLSFTFLITGLLLWVASELHGSSYTLQNAILAIKMLIAYPPLFIRIILETYPWVTLILILTSIGIAISASNAQKFSPPLLILILFLVPLFVMGIHPLALDRLYERYVYFLTPYLLIIVAYGISQASDFFLKKWNENQKLVACSFIVALISLTALSGGFSLSRSIAKVTAEYGMNMDIYDRWTRKHYYHPDHKGPSLFVASQYQNGDLVIAMDILAHYAYFPIADYQLIISRKRDAEGWIGKTTITSAEELTSVLDNASPGRIWIITAGLHIHDNKDEKEFISIMNTISEFSGEAKYFGKDGDSNVYCVNCISN